MKTTVMSIALLKTGQAINSNKKSGPDIKSGPLAKLYSYFAATGVLASVLATSQDICASCL